MANLTILTKSFKLVNFANLVMSFFNLTQCLSNP